MRALPLLLTITAVSNTACITYDRATLAAVSTAMVPIGMTVVAEDVEGKVCSDMFMHPLERAIDDAMRRAPGANALVDASIHFERLCVIVRGTAIRSP